MKAMSAFGEIERITRETRRSSRWVTVLVMGPILGGVFLLGVVLWWQDRRDGDEAGQWVAAALIVAAVSGAGWFACHVDQHSAPGPLFDDERRCLVIPQSGWTGASRIAAFTPWGLYLAAASVTTPELAVFTAPAAAYLLGPAVMRLLGRWRPGGLWFDQDGITYRSPGSERSLPWGQITAVGQTDRHYLILGQLDLEMWPVEGLAVRAGEGHAVTERRHTPLWRFRPWRRDEIFIRTETLGVGLPRLEHFCTTLIRRPKARAQLSDPKILQAIEDPAFWRRRLR